MASMTLAACTREIIELHDFFQAWFTGTVNDDEANFERFAGVMDDAFTIIGPDGLLTELASLVDRLQRAHANYADLRIWTENHRLLRQHGDWLLCTYEEWQETPPATTVRLSSVLFQHDDSTPNGVRWLHVHETWLSS